MTESFTMKPIGVVSNGCDDTAKAMEMMDTASTIIVDKSFEEGLYMIDTNEYVDIVFYFHKSEAGTPSSGTPSNSTSIDSSLHRKTKSGEIKGVFSTRSPFRPNGIGISTVKLLERDGNRIIVSGLDAVNGTPVLDIKACNTSHLDDRFSEGEVTRGGFSFRDVHSSVLKSNPRIAIRKYIMAGDTEKLLMLAAQMHGHYCPGLSMGVMAAVYAMRNLSPESPSERPGPPEAAGSPPDSDGLEDLLAIVETNNCFADGVQLVTGCSFGNNSLVFHDLGKTAFTLTRRDGKGIRVISRPDAQACIRDAFPDFDKRYQRVVQKQVRDDAEVAAFKKSGVERSFGTLKLDFNRLFDTARVQVAIPEYAPSHGSEVCNRCGESVMATRVVPAGWPEQSGPVSEKQAAASGINPETENKGEEKSTIHPMPHGEKKPGLCITCAGISFATLDGGGIHTCEY